MLQVGTKTRFRIVNFRAPERRHSSESAHADHDLPLLPPTISTRPDRGGTDAIVIHAREHPRERRGFFFASRGCTIPRCRTRCSRQASAAATPGDGTLAGAEQRGKVRDAPLNSNDPLG